MARWRLQAAHYLACPGTEWEYKETDQASGRQARKIYSVPRYLNPNDVGECNYPRGIEDYEEPCIVVCYEGKGKPKDIVFMGEPTPDMAPLDDEAIAISDSLRHKWKHPMENDQIYSQSLLSSLEKEVAALAAGQARPASSPSAEEFATLQAQVKELNAKLAARRA